MTILIPALDRPRARQPLQLMHMFMGGKLSQPTSRLADGTFRRARSTGKFVVAKAREEVECYSLTLPLAFYSCPRCIGILIPHPLLWQEEVAESA